MHKPMLDHGMAIEVIIVNAGYGQHAAFRREAASPEGQNPNPLFLFSTLEKPMGH